MAKYVAFWTLGQLAQALGGELRGPEDWIVERPQPVHSNDPRGLTFVSSEEYLRQAMLSGVGALLVPRQAPPIAKPAIAVDDPRASFGRFLAMCIRPLPFEAGIDARAVVSPEATVDPTASVGPFAVVERGAVVGPRARVYPFAYVGEGCTLGADVVIYPHAVLYQSIDIGDRSIVHAGAVLGADGFGYVWDGVRRVKIPQVGGVRLGSDVEIGALTGIDRSTAGDTEIGDGVKLDNLIQIGHNCSVGDHTVIASLTGISGSTSIGKRNTIAGQCATSDHVNTADDVVLGGRTGVTKDVGSPGTYWGLPAQPVGEAMRVQVLMNKLPDLFNRLRTLEKRVKELEGR